MAQNQPFIVDVRGPFEQGKVIVRHCHEPWQPASALAGLIAATWPGQLERAQRLGIMLYNGKLARYLRHKVEGDSLIIEAGETDYAGFMGTNYLNGRLANEMDWREFANPIGTSATVVTSDGWLLYGRRSDRVICHAGYVHTFGGGLEPADGLGQPEIDPFSCIQRELGEELAIQPAEITRMVCLGLLRDPAIHQPELIFDAWVSATRGEIEARMAPDGPEQEHAELLACREEPRAASEFARRTRLLAPIALGALLLHGLELFGLDWYNRTLAVSPHWPPPEQLY